MQVWNRSRGQQWKHNPNSNARGDYVLATGNAAANRLRILHDVYGPGARQLLLRAGLRRGMSVVDLGCGVGMTTQLLAEIVGPTGQSVYAGYDLRDR
jgi:predicted methyltransferase